MWRTSRNFHGLCMAALLLASASVAHAATAPKQFFRALPAAAKVARSERAPGVASDALPVQVNLDEMTRLQPGEEVELRLPQAAGRIVVFELGIAHGGGIHSWVGHFKERGENNRVIVTSGPGGAYGVIDAPEGSFRIVPGGAHDWLVDMAKERALVPAEDAGDDERVSPPQPLAKATLAQKPTFQEPGIGIGALAKAAPAPLAVIDLMFVVTRTLATRLGPTLMTRLHFLVTRANLSYAASDVGINLRLVNLAVVDYSDTIANNTALSAITPVAGGGTGVFAAIEAQRTASGADMVAFMRDGSSFGGSGVAWVGALMPSNPAVMNNPLFMYSLITGCVLGCESVFIHEVGHNMGNKHDRATNAWQSGSPNGAFNYSFGYVYCQGGTLTCIPDTVSNLPGTCTTGAQPECSVASTSNFRDIMAYFQGSTQELYRFSNALQVDCATANGDGIPRPCGVSDALVNSADTAKSMNITRTAISAIKTQVAAALMPGSLQFTQSAYSGAESGGSIVFTVSRVRDSTLLGGGGAVSVNYTLTAATAAAGGDFTVGGGTLNWADGDFADKTFSVPLVIDGVAEPIETFTATLSNAAGAPGVFLGYPTIAAGIILEAWPPGGVMPAGFVTPAGSAGAWTVASDQAFEGPNSLRSARIFGPDLATYANSDLVYSGSIAAGQATFAYRVSSYQSYGVFEFMLDGTTILSDTGETGWKTFVFNIPSSGQHTLTWRFKNRLTSACNSGWNPPPQGGAACADRVWIDAVSLPPAAPDPPRLSNISTRMQVLSGNDVMIGGFVIGGSASKTVVIRARGPSLIPFGIANALANPTLQLVRSSDQSTLATNDDWANAPNVSALAASGFAPSNALESAILATLPPGAYTAIVSGVGGGTGVGIVEVFEVDATDNPLANISTRGQVRTGNDVMIGGFVVQGSGPQTVVVRARGPSLVPFGIANALGNPTLQLVRSSDQVTLATNDDWGTATNAAAITASGFAPSNALESAIMITLPPGAYTAVVSGVGGATGVGIVEVFVP